MPDVEDFTELEDYEEIKEFLEQDPEKFEKPTNLPDFEPGISLFREDCCNRI